MAVIVIKDLPDSMDLDRQAMTTILGGGRTAGGQAWHGWRHQGAARIFDYRGGLPGNRQVMPREAPLGRLPRKAAGKDAEG
ncbi:hypothetical protein [Cupriavidus taiwanensis]|uniref:Uncharacterized protein n=2 Tax=Cupriavidus taiwanensis TaxID=164546 RepID=B3R5A1_CUPTR|nr:hypothetical protein [Cupriavidus taiwanensis]CAQ70124.1 conserved hypothetical protein [Cupriavidus taiwanensis LMG 19424]SOY45292.1 conserved hypothetical protein [Cupriavidus taiwanensis]SOY88492.1 conserved hypothetical protein [Cupriavidus taiwanensis]SOZ06037.1 conserved hypothetical protein [Cupriavidus taiwanensis]SOZ08023.1 conserved hypothetical protein [Cupriavidus taiwanensis]